jgi:hypothetical protein
VLTACACAGVAAKHAAKQPAERAMTRLLVRQEKFRGVGHFQVGRMAVPPGRFPFSTSAALEN